MFSIKMFSIKDYGRKDRARRIPQEKGNPRRIELRHIKTDQYKTLCRSLQNYHSNDYYIACAVTSNNLQELLSFEKRTCNRYPASTTTPAQWPPLLNDHPFYTKNCTIAPFITQPKQVRLPSN
jgi:hypothetical protein